MKVVNFGCLLINNTRSKAFIQKLFRESLYPEKIIYVDLQKKKKMNYEKDEQSILIKAFHNRKYFLYEQNSKTIYPVHKKKWEKYASFDPDKPVVETLKENNADYELLHAESLNDKHIVAAVKKTALEYFLFAGGGILEKEILSTGTKFIHIHPGYLPDVKGSMAIEWSILLHGKCAATAFFMVEKIDRGDIIARKYFDIPEIEHNSVPALFSSHVRSELLIEIIKEYVLKNKFETIPQDSSDGILYYKMHPALHNVVFHRCKQL